MCSLSLGCYGFSRHQVIPWQTTPLDIKDLSKQVLDYYSITSSFNWCLFYSRGFSPLPLLPLLPWHSRVKLMGLCSPGTNWPGPHLRVSPL